MNFIRIYPVKLFTSPRAKNARWSIIKNVTESSKENFPNFKRWASQLRNLCSSLNLLALNAIVYRWRLLGESPMLKDSVKPFTRKEKIYEIVVKDMYTNEVEQQSVICGQRDTRIYVAIDVAVSDRYEIYIMRAGDVPSVSRKKA